MPWLQLRLDCTPHNCSALEDALLEAGAIAVTIEDRADQPLFEPPPGETPLWHQTRLSGLFDATCNTDEIIQNLKNSVPEPLPPHRYEILEDKDWEREWMKNYHPMQFGRRLWICPSWTPPPQPDAINIALDPGLAFGTGTHPTTALCLKWLDDQNLHGKSVIDYGCGSGILAIAAVLLGAKQVIAVDNDPQALLATRENARRNHITEQQLSILLPSQLPTDTSSDLVIANILAGPLIELADTIAQCVSAKGKLCLSGILEEQIPQLIGRYQHWFEFLPAEKEEEWVRLVGTKP